MLLPSPSHNLDITLNHFQKNPVTKELLKSIKLPKQKEQEAAMNSEKNKAVVMMVTKTVTTVVETITMPVEAPTTPVPVKIPTTPGEMMETATISILKEQEMPQENPGRVEEKNEFEEEELELEMMSMLEREEKKYEKKKLADAKSAMAKRKVAQEEKEWISFAEEYEREEMEKLAKETAAATQPLQDTASHMQNTASQDAAGHADQETAEEGLGVTEQNTARVQDAADQMQDTAGSQVLVQDAAEIVQNTARTWEPTWGTAGLVQSAARTTTPSKDAAGDVQYAADTDVPVQGAANPTILDTAASADDASQQTPSSNEVKDEPTVSHTNVPSQYAAGTEQYAADPDVPVHATASPTTPDAAEAAEVPSQQTNSQKEVQDEPTMSHTTMPSQGAAGDEQYAADTDVPVHAAASPTTLDAAETAEVPSQQTHSLNEVQDESTMAHTQDVKFATLYSQKELVACPPSPLQPSRAKRIADKAAKTKKMENKRKERRSCLMSSSRTLLEVSPAKRHPDPSKEASPSVRMLATFFSTSDSPQKLPSIPPASSRQSMVPQWTNTASNAMKAYLPCVESQASAEPNQAADRKSAGQ